MWPVMQASRSVAGNCGVGACKEGQLFESMEMEGQMGEARNNINQTIRLGKLGRV